MLTVKPIKRTEETQIVVSAYLAKKRDVLWNVADLPLGPRIVLGDQFSVQHDPATIGIHRSGDDGDHGRLPRSIRSEQSITGAVAYAK